MLSSTELGDSWSEDHWRSWVEGWGVLRDKSSTLVYWGCYQLRPFKPILCRAKPKWQCVYQNCTKNYRRVIKTVSIDRVGWWQTQDNQHKSTPTILNQPKGTLHAPSENSAGVKVSLATVTRRIIGVIYDTYNPVAVSENRAAKASEFHRPGKQRMNATKILNQIARAGLSVHESTWYHTSE